MKRNQITIILLMLAAPFSGTSQKNLSDASENAAAKDSIIIAEKLGDVTVTAFRVPYKLANIPAPVHLIAPAQLETGSALTPVEALNQVPGVLMHHGTLNTNRLTIRGIGSRTPYATNKIKAYLGDIPLTGGDGETTLEDIDNQFIQRIEIIKGPSSSLYGAGLGGTILLHPKTSGNDYLQHEMTAASFKTVKNTFSMGLNHQKLYIFALGSALSSQGYRENNATKRYNLMVHSTIELSKKLQLATLIKMTRMKAFIPSSIDMDTYLESPWKAAENWKGMNGYEAYDKGQLGLSANIQPDNGNKISMTAFGSFRDAREPRPFNLLEEASGYFGVRGYYQKEIKTGPVKMAFTSGIEVFREHYSWSTQSNQPEEQMLSDNKELRAYENLFVQWETNYREKLYLSAGVNGNLTRFRYTDHYLPDGNQSGNRSFSPVISPRFGTNYRISEAVTCFGNISHGFSIPSFEETLLPEGTINPGIKPESGLNLEAGIRTAILNRFRASLSFYRISVKNLLVARRTGEDAYVGVNAGKSVHPGLEAEMKWIVFNPRTYPSLVLNGNITLTNYRFHDFVDGDHNYSGNLLPGTSRETWLLAGNFQPDRQVTIRAWHRYTGKMPVNDSNSGFTDPYGLTNLEVKYSAGSGKLYFELKTGIQNIFNVRHVAMLAINAPSFGNALPRYYYPGNLRNYHLTLQIGWNGSSALESRD